MIIRTNPVSVNFEDMIRFDQDDFNKWTENNNIVWGFAIRELKFRGAAEFYFENAEDAVAFRLKFDL